MVELFQALTMRVVRGNPGRRTGGEPLERDSTMLTRRLGDDGEAGELRTAPRRPCGTAPVARSRAERAVVAYIVEQLQLMENVFFEFKFEHRAHRANPRRRAG